MALPEPETPFQRAFREHFMVELPSGDWLICRRQTAQWTNHINPALKVVATCHDRISAELVYRALDAQVRARG